jgi:hypothetical protein
MPVIGPNLPLLPLHCRTSGILHFEPGGRAAAAIGRALRFDTIPSSPIPEKVKGGPYARYILVVVTDESLLGREDVAKFLEGAIFRPLHGGLARGDPSAVKISTQVCAVALRSDRLGGYGPPRSEYIKVLRPSGGNYGRRPYSRGHCRWTADQNPREISTR